MSDYALEGLILDLEIEDIKFLEAQPSPATACIHLYDLFPPPHMASLFLYYDGEYETFPHRRFILINEMIVSVVRDWLSLERGLTGEETVLLLQRT